MTQLRDSEQLRIRPPCGICWCAAPGGPAGAKPPDAPWDPRTCGVSQAYGNETATIAREQTQTFTPNEAGLLSTTQGSSQQQRAHNGLVPGSSPGGPTTHSSPSGSLARFAKLSVGSKV